jgi:alpha-L-fucosidase
VDGVLFSYFEYHGSDLKSDWSKMAAHAKKQELFYYSPPDMHHPAFRDTTKLAKENWEGEPARPEWPLYLDYMQLQLTELLTGYGPVALIWFDGLNHQEKYGGVRFLDLIRKLQPATLVNDRIGELVSRETTRRRNSSFPVPSRPRMSGLTLSIRASSRN